MIVLDGVSLRSGATAITQVSASWGAGIHALVGARQDGGPLLLAAISGAATPRRGKIRVLGHPPTEMGSRRRIARIDLEPALPESLRVRELLGLAAQLRGEIERDALDRLDELGVGALADRRVASLSRAEARAVALAEAVTSSRVQTLLVEEPRIQVDTRAAPFLHAALEAKVRGGCTVVLATASIVDASSLASDLVLLQRGAIVGRFASLERAASFTPEGARLLVLFRSTADACAVASLLAGDPAVATVERDATTVRLGGPDAMQVARAATLAIASAGVDVLDLHFGAPSLDDARAAAAGTSAATYEAAYRRTRDADEKRTVTPPPTLATGGGT